MNVPLKLTPETTENFLIYLDSKSLSERYIKDTLYYYKKFYNNYNPEKDLQLEVNRFISDHKTFIARACIKNLLEFLNRTDIKIPKLSGTLSKKVYTSLKEKEVQLVINEIYKRDDIYGQMVELMYWTAIRVGELSSIKIKDFEIESWEHPESCLLKIHGKGQRERFVLVPTHLMLKIGKRILSMDKESYLFWDKSKFGFAKILKRAGNKVLNKRVHPHAFRRARATHLRQNKVDVFNIKNFLGHSSILTTQIYINPSEEETLEAIETELMKRVEE